MVRGLVLYKNILLASDGTRETLVTLREGALLAQTLQANAHLIIIQPETTGALIATGLGGHQFPDQGKDLLKVGLDRLRRLGVGASGELLRGDPAQLIVNCARRVRADLIVLGHRRQSFLARWWSASSSVQIVDDVACSVLVARDSITDEEFDRHLAVAPTVAAKRD